MGRDTIAEINGHKYRYAYDPESKAMKYLGPLGDGPALTEREFFDAMSDEMLFGYQRSDIPKMKELEIRLFMRTVEEWFREHGGYEWHDAPFSHQNWGITDLKLYGTSPLGKKEWAAAGTQSVYSPPEVVWLYREDVNEMLARGFDHAIKRIPEEERT